MSEAESDVIARLVAETQDPTMRAVLLMVLAQQRSIHGLVSSVGKAVDALERFEIDFAEHRTEFREHVTTEDAMLRASLTVGKWAAAAVTLLLGSVLGMGVWVFQGLVASVERDSLEQQRMHQQIDVNTKRLDSIERRLQP